MLALLWMAAADAGPVPMFQSPQPLVPMFTAGPGPLVAPPAGGAPGPVAVPWFWTWSPPVDATSPARAFPALPPPPTEKTAWQKGKTKIETPGTFVPIDQLPSAFRPLEPAVDRLQRPELD